MNYCKTFIALGGALGLSAAGALADRPQPRLLGNPIPVSPLRVAGVQKIGDRVQMTTPWMEYGEGGIAGPTICSAALAFDNFEPDRRALNGFLGPADGCADGGYEPACGLGDQRWFFGTSYCNMYTVNDLTVAPGCAGDLSERVAFAWYWTGDGVGSETCIIVVFTAEDFDDTCAGPPFDGEYNGVAYSFGPLPENPGGYYFTDVADLCDFGLGHQLPLDGSGAYSILLLRELSDVAMTLATCAQPMLWGTKPTSAGSQGPIQWHDDTPNDGSHDGSYECRDNTFGTCPDPLGATIVFFGNDGVKGLIGDANCDCVVDFFDIDAAVTCILSSGAACCDPLRVDANGDDIIDFFDLDAVIGCILAGGC